MKKIFLYITLFLSASMAFIACEKDEIEKTASNAMSGEWMVTYDGVNATGDTIVYADPFGMGEFHFDTYNTSSDGTTAMYVDDHGNSWGFKNKVSINYDNLTFSCDSTVEDINGATVVITNGKILLGAATTPSGSVADSIVFDIWFSDDNYAGTYWDRIQISGYRYTGLAGDEAH